MKTSNNFFKKNLVFFIVVGVLIIIEIFLFSWSGSGVLNISTYFHKKTPSVEGIILFESQNCSHCQNVETFISKNNVESKVAFTRLQVVNNGTNADILADKAQICGLDYQQIGVPFLWDGKNCVVGDVDIIKFFQQKIGKK